MRTNIHHINALTTQLFCDAKDHYFKTGHHNPAAEHYSNAIALCKFAQYDISHSDVLHIITTVEWQVLEAYEQHAILYDIDIENDEFDYAEIPF